MNLGSLRPILLVPAGIMALSCTTGQHVAKVDKEVYNILKTAEAHVYHKNKNLRIDGGGAETLTDRVTSSSLQKKSATTGSVVFSIQDAIDYAVKNSNSYQSEKEALYLAGLSMSDTKIPYQWGARSTAGVSRDRSSGGQQSFSADTNQSVDKLFRAGTSVGLNLANDLLKVFTSGSERSISSVVSFNLLQPLLRGRGAEIAAERLNQSYRNVIYQMRNYNSFQQNFHREIVIDYLDIIQLLQVVDNERKNLESRQENFEYLEARSVDRARPSEVADAQQDKLQAEVRLVNAQTSYESALDTFKVTLGMPAGMTLKLKPSELDRVSQAGLLPLNLSESNAYHKALKFRGDLLNEVDRFEDSRRDVILAADDLKTQIDFVANASLANSGDRWERFNFDQVNTSIGLELDLPVNRERERNSYRRALISFQSDARSLRQSHDQLKNTIRLRLRQLSQFKKNYDIQVGALKLAENRVEGDKLRLKAGTLIFRRLSESQDALIQARNSVTDALVNYQESRLRILEELGVLDINKKDFWLKK